MCLRRWKNPRDVLLVIDACAAIPGSATSLVRRHADVDWLISCRGVVENRVLDRTGHLHCVDELDCTLEGNRVELRGGAVMVLEGKLRF